MRTIEEIDPDETAGRALYRAKADALAKFQVNLSTLKPVIRKAHTTTDHLAEEKLK